MILRIPVRSPNEHPESDGVPNQTEFQRFSIDPPRFSALPTFRTRRSPAFGCSVLGHAAAVVAAMFWSGLPESKTAPVMQSYSVRYLQLQVPPPARLSPGAASAGEPRLAVIPAARAAKAAIKAAPGSAPVATMARVGPRKFELPRLPQVRRVEQTVIQLELPPEVLPIADVRVPAVLIWAQTQNLPRPPAKKFIAPVRREVPRNQASILAEPKLELSNQERNIADVNFSAVRVTDVPLLPKPPSRTTPIRIINSGASGSIPETSGADAVQREAANIISIPDLPLPAGKMLLVPLLNQVATSQMYGAGDQSNGSEERAGNSGAGSTGAGANGSAPRSGKAGDRNGDSGSGSSAGSGVAAAGASGTLGRGEGQGTLARVDVNGAGVVVSTGERRGSGSGAGSGIGDGSGTGSARPIVRIESPKDGHFPAVVLGLSSSSQYEEAAGVLAGRLVYTVHLRVGTKKSWILQYCLPRSAEQAANLKGVGTPVEPPFPFLILRPELEFAPEMDYVIVHGIVNSSGKLEQLSLLGAAGFAQEHVLFSSLGLWQFRPAARDGQPITVEILLIIPREEV
jgi:hypothetical protein